jgi:aspartate kinase
VVHHIVIQKFGGTSVQDSDAMARAIEIVRDRGIMRRTRPLVVLSACAGVTNSLIRISELSLKETTADALSFVDQLEVRHARIARELIEEEDTVAEVHQGLHKIWEELRTRVRGVNLLRELTPKSRDQIQSLGERASTTIFHAALQEQLEEDDIACHFLDARDFIITSNEFTAARPLMSEITRRMKKIHAALAKGAVGVTQGFIGRTLAGETTTIGRGGSDFSAAIMGVVMDAREIQIWTDVAGIMTCDPRIAPAAWTIGQISFHEASELAFFGAKVLHPETIWPAVEKSIPVHVLSSMEPEKDGTVIVEETEESRAMTGIAVKRSISFVRISSNGSQPNPAVQQTVWNALGDANIIPLAVSLSVDGASFAFGDASAVPILRATCEGLAHLDIQSDRSLITLVGSGLYTQSGIAARMFRALGRTNCEMVSYGGSESAISLVVQDDVANKVVKKLHNEFFE